MREQSFKGVREQVDGFQMKIVLPGPHVECVLGGSDAGGMEKTGNEGERQDGHLREFPFKNWLTGAEERCNSWKMWGDREGAKGEVD